MLADILTTAPAVSNTSIITNPTIAVTSGSHPLSNSPEKVSFPATRERVSRDICIGEYTVSPIGTPITVAAMIPMQIAPFTL